MTYKYQMHAHTSPCSACGKMSAEELVEGLRLGGYQGCVITNHFLHGNSGIDRGLSWADFVKEYENDYLKGKHLAEKYDMDFIFGIEEGMGNGFEIICYGITPQILYEHPELCERNIEIWHRVLSSYGVLIIQAHPYRTRDYIPKPGLLPLEYIDGIEVFNSENSLDDNMRASQEAQAHPEWIILSGADTHWVDTACNGGIGCDERIRDEKELVSVLISGKYKLIIE